MTGDQCNPLRATHRANFGKPEFTAVFPARETFPPVLKCRVF
jgi:hypothetical protein